VRGDEEIAFDAVVAEKVAAGQSGPGLDGAVRVTRADGFLADRAGLVVVGVWDGGGGGLFGLDEFAGHGCGSGWGW